MPAILRSELESGLDGLSKDMTEWQMSLGHCTCQMMGGRGQAPANQTPPAPREEASQKPMYPGSWSISSQQWDGCEAWMQRRMLKLLSMEHSALLDAMVIHCLEVRRAMLMGPSSPRPAGILMHACQSLPWSHSRSFLGTFVHQRIAQSSDCMCSCFSVGSSMHWHTPSNTQPSSSFQVSHRLSPWSSFFIMTGSSSVPPVTDGGGKTVWMAWSRAREM